MEQRVPAFQSSLKGGWRRIFFEAMSDDPDFEYLIVDSTIADHLRHAIAAKGALAVIPNNPSRAIKYPLDKHLYAPATSRPMLLLKTQAVPPRRNPFREDRPKLSGSRNNRRNRPVDAITVHTT